MSVDAYGYFCAESEFSDNSDKERLLNRFCEEREINMHMVFVEESEPDIDKLTVRKTMAKMLYQIPLGFQVVVPSAATFTLNINWRAILLHEFRQRKIMVLSAETGKDITKANGQEHLNAMQFIDTFVAHQYQMKGFINAWSTTIDPNRFTGRHRQNSPFGSLPSEARTVQLILELKAQGMSYNQIKDFLNSNIDQYSPRLTNRWTHERVRLIHKRNTKDRSLKSNRRFISQ